MTSKILVTGSTGTVGSELVRQLSAKDVQVRAFARSSEKAKTLKRANVEITSGDMGEPETIEKALAGVDKVFLLSSPDLNQVALQGNVVDASKNAGVQHIVKLSALGVSPDSPVSIARLHAQTEKQIEDSGIAYTHLRPHFFMQNFFMFAATIKEKGEFYSAMKDAKTSIVDVRDVAAVAVAVLTESGHEGKTYNITGPEAISYPEAAEKLSAAIGKKVNYVDIPLAALKQGMMDMGMPEWFADDLAKLTEFFSSGQTAFVSPVVTEVARKPGITFDRFVKDYVQAFK